MNRRDEVGQTTLLIVGFAVILAMVMAVVVDASAAYLQRQELDTLADGAALFGAEGGAQGRETYEGGLGERADQYAASAHAAVLEYFRSSGAYQSFPGLRADITVTADSVVVDVRAPIDLPLTVPGSPERPVIGATGSAVVTIAR